MFSLPKPPHTHVATISAAHTALSLPNSLELNGLSLVINEPFFVLAFITLPAKRLVLPVATACEWLVSQKPGAMSSILHNITQGVRHGFYKPQSPSVPSTWHFLTFTCTSPLYLIFP